MDRESFYRKLAAALTRQGFHLQAGDDSQEGLSRERNQAAAAIRSVVAVVGQRLVPQFDHDVIQRHLDAVREWAAIACFKYSLSQPVMIAFVEADRLSEDDILTLKNRFDQVVVEMLEVTAKLEVGGPGKVRLGSLGILVFVFFDPLAAARFAMRMQRKCKVFHFFKKAYIVPWLIDVANGTVRKHRGLPFLTSSVLNRDRLQNDIFQ